MMLSPGALALSTDHCQNNVKMIVLTVPIPFVGKENI